MRLYIRICLLSIAIVFIQMVSLSAGYGEASKEITISAAMSLKNAFEEFGKRYEAGHKGVKIMFNFGASGDLSRQIEGGAPIDAFASASKKEMDDLEEKGLVLSGSRNDFASNTVVLIVPLHTKVRIKSFTDLESKEIKRIALGNPKTSPAGRYAEEVFQYYKLMPAVKDKLIFTGNVSQVLDYVARGEVDAGIVYATDFMTRANDVSIAATAPMSSHAPIIYPFALIRGARNEGLPKEFVSLLISGEGRKILKKYGFVPAQNKNVRSGR